jgi:hypothetical protein
MARGLISRGTILLLLSPSVQLFQITNVTDAFSSRRGEGGSSFGICILLLTCISAEVKNKWNNSSTSHIRLRGVRRDKFACFMAFEFKKKVSSLHARLFATQLQSEPHVTQIYSTLLTYSTHFTLCFFLFICPFPSFLSSFFFSAFQFSFSFIIIACRIRNGPYFSLLKLFMLALQSYAEVVSEDNRTAFPFT